MAATVSAKKPTRVSKRIRNIKKAAATAATAASTTNTTVTTNTTTKNTRKNKTNRKAVKSKVTKRVPTKKPATSNANKTYATHHRFSLEPAQLSNILEPHSADGNDQMWVSGAFHAVDPGEEVPAGSVEIDIKVPAGLRFLVFPGVLRLVEGEEMEEAGALEKEGEMEGEDELQQDENEGESSDSELSK
jgi:hypothetical protein